MKIGCAGTADGKQKVPVPLALTLIEWLSGNECHDLDEAEVIAHLGRKLVAAGLPISRLTLHLRTLHPEIIGRTLAWAPGERVEMHDREYGIEQSALFVGSPLQRAMQCREWSTTRLDGYTASEWMHLDVFRNRNLTEVIVAPLPNADGSVSAATFGTTRSTGFTASDQRLLERIAPALRTACELLVLRQSEANLLDVYVGPQTGSRILAGHIRRGDVESIEASLLFCDLRGFTELSNRLPAARVLQLLNLYYDQVVPAVASKGGEIVKFMGDGLLAIFHLDEGPEASCAAALQAAVSALERLAHLHQPGADLRAGIALHHGAISYGNIGSGQRLDFTVIGPAVNLTSRLQALCGYGGRPPLLMSAGFADLLGRVDVVPVGRYALKGFEGPIEAFRLCPDEKTTNHARGLRS